MNRTLRKEDLSIIVVDDLQFSREVVKSGLTKSGFIDIRTAASADEGMYLLNDRRADVVLADFWMPGLNGLEMTDLIRRWDESNDRYTGVVLLTAEDTTSSIVVAFDRGVDDFVSKSANQFELAARVFGAGRAAHQQNELRKRTQSAGDQLMRTKQFCLQDSETGLPNRNQMEVHLQSLIDHGASRGGGLALGLIEVNTDNAELRSGTLKAIANSLQLALRPLDLVSRFNGNTFAVLVYYQDPLVFKVEMFRRLLSSIKRHTHGTSDEGGQLQMSAGVWHVHKFDPLPTVAEAITAAQNATIIID
ncbi:MAG: response regulator [Gammaproteobacteria bacterium]|nr:response regulator [Gammaproteobacteria bacterium]